MYFLLVLFYLKAESNVVTMVKLKGAVPYNLAGFRFFCLRLLPSLGLRQFLLVLLLQLGLGFATRLMTCFHK